MFSTRKQITEAHREKRTEIRSRLEEFRKVFGESDERVFAELAYCVMTANGRAKAALSAQDELERTNIILNGNVEKIRECLKRNGVRFSPKKANYIINNRNNLMINGKIKIKNRLTGNPFDLREIVVKDKKCFKGLSYKEVSHFLRNIGFSGLAILDRHILKNLHELGVIKEIPKTMTKKRYLEIENKMKIFCNGVGVPMDEMDLLLWSEESGEILK